MRPQSPELFTLPQTAIHSPHLSRVVEQLTHEALFHAMGRRRYGDVELADEFERAAERMSEWRRAAERLGEVFK